MKNTFILSEEEKNRILNMYSKNKQPLFEEVINYTIQDIQNTLNSKYGEKLVPDNKFGKLTGGAISRAIDKIKTAGVPTSSGSTTGATINTGSTVNTANTGSTVNPSATVNPNVTNTPKTPTGDDKNINTTNLF